MGLLHLHFLILYEPYNLRLFQAFVVVVVFVVAVVFSAGENGRRELMIVLALELNNFPVVAVSSLLISWHWPTFWYSSDFMSQTQLFNCQNLIVSCHFFHEGRSCSKILFCGLNRRLKSVLIRNYSGPRFPVFSPNAGKCGPE